MAKTKEERRANREKRRVKRKLRKEKFNDLLDKVKSTPEPTEEEFLQDPKENFHKYWPILRAVLDFAIVLKVTGENVDDILAKIVVIGNKMYNGTAEEGESDEFIEKLHKVWGISRKALTIVTIVTDDKTDEVIEKAIAIGDWISSVDEEDED